MSDIEQLTRQVRELKARVTAMESSRWWRLHPRFALQRLRGKDATHVDEEQHAFPLDFEEADKELYRRVGRYTMTTPPRVYALVRAVEYVAARGIPGAIVECGVWRGGSMMAAALTLQRLGATDRDLYLYDTFAGMPPPSEADTTRSGERAADLLAQNDDSSHIWAIASLEDVREAVLSVGYPQERIHFVEGLVEETLPANAPEQIALLRLDTDWYASTKHELEHLYPRLSPGGVLIVDDYGHWQGARRAVDEYFAGNAVTLLLNRIDGTARIAVKPG
jgi:O-methyltransferase